MTEKLKELFDLADQEQPKTQPDKADIEQAFDKLKKQTTALALSGKIDHALAPIDELDKHEREMDLIAEDAIETYGNLIDMAMNVEAQYTARLMEVAAQMMRNAIDARQLKMNAKLRQLELQLKKLQSDRSAGQKDTGPNAETPVEGQVYSRNDLLKKLQTGK